jgi:hypothetical protein
MPEVPLSAEPRFCQADFSAAGLGLKSLFLLAA